MRNLVSTLLVSALTILSPIKTGQEAKSMPPQPETALWQNIPDPFDGVTLIPYTIGQRNVVNLEIYDILGNNIRTVIGNDISEPGNYVSIFSAENSSGTPLTSGVYFYKLTAGKFIGSKRMVINRN